MSPTPKTKRAAPAATPRVRKRRAAAPASVQTEPEPEPINDPSTSDRPVDSPSTSDPPVDAEVLVTVSHEMDDENAATAEHPIGQEIEAPPTTPEASTSYTNPTVRFFNGHPLLDPYPLDMLPNRGILADGSFNPIIELKDSARERIETLMGHVTTVTLNDGRILSDAREVIAVSDGKDFRAYMKESTAEHVKFRNSIKAKWSRTLAHIPAVYIKFDDVSREVAYVDRRGYMDIMHKGIGEPSAVEREKQLQVMMGIYGNDASVLAETTNEINQELNRPKGENRIIIFMKGAEFENARRR